MFLVFYLEGGSIIAEAEGNCWLYFSKMVQTYWGIFFLSLFITLQTALMAGIEHHGQMWDLIYTQPVRRLNILRAKYFTNYFILGISQMILYPLTILSGLLLRKLNCGLGLEAAIPFGEIALQNISVFGFSFLAIAIQIWISLRWESFVTAVSSGIVATVSSVVMINSKFAYFYPWSMPGLLANHFLRADYPWINLVYSLALGTLVILGSLLDLVSKETY